MSAYTNSTPPQQARPERPRTVSMMSQASTTRSHKTSKSREEKKLELTESAKDKRRLEGFSDPTKALQAAEPSAVALEDSNLENLRGVQYKDRDGNIIRDPDRSNPTRPRLERPLDTIRSFNAAAEGTTSRRSSYQRPQSQYNHNNGGNQWEGQSRPGSYYGQHGGRPGPRPGQSNSGYYSNSYQRPQSQFYRGDSFPEEGEQRGMDYSRGPMQRGPNVPYVDQYDHSPQQQQQYQQQQQAAPIRRNQHSYDTMTSGSDEMSKSTNPSSENSSFDQLHQAGQRKPEAEYPSNPYRQPGPGYGNGNGRHGLPLPAFQNGNNYGARPSGPIDDYGMEVGSDAPPPPPKHKDMMSGGRLQKTNSNTRPEHPGKRQSWIKRTFSKRAWD